MGICIAGLGYLCIWLSLISVNFKYALSFIWSAKCVVGLLIMPFLERLYFGGDATYYFEAAHTVMENPPTFGDGTQVIMLLTFLIQSIFKLLQLPVSFHGVKLCFSFIGLIASFVYYRAACRILKTEKIAMLYVLGLFPSILYWSSIFGKDPVTMLGFGLFALGMSGWVNKPNLIDFLWGILGIAIASAIRIWAGLFMMIAVLAVAVTQTKGIFSRILIS